MERVKCCVSGLRFNTCYECRNNIIEEGCTIHGHDCPDAAEYECQISVGGRRICGGDKPFAFCRAHAIDHLRRDHNMHSHPERMLGALVKLAK